MLDTHGGVPITALVLVQRQDHSLHLLPIDSLQDVYTRMVHLGPWSVTFFAGNLSQYFRKLASSVDSTPLILSTEGETFI